MSRPVIIVAARNYLFRHVLATEITRLRAEMCVAEKDWVVPSHEPIDLRLCETPWPKEICTCRHFTLEWEDRKRSTIYE